MDNVLNLDDLSEKKEDRHIVLNGKKYKVRDVTVNDLIKIDSIQKGDDNQKLIEFMVSLVEGLTTDDINQEQFIALTKFLSRGVITEDDKKINSSPDTKSKKK